MVALFNLLIVYSSALLGGLLLCEAFYRVLQHMGV